MRIELINKKEYEQFEKENSTPYGEDPFNFAFKFKVSEFENTTLHNYDLIGECVQFIEKLEAFDDYDDWEMEIKYQPDFSEILIEIVIVSKLN